MCYYYTCAKLSKYYSYLNNVRINKCYSLYAFAANYTDFAKDLTY